MHAAPPVSAHSGGGRCWSGVQMALPALAAASFAAWACGWFEIEAPGSDIAAMGAAAAAAVAALVARRGWRRQRRAGVSSLVWDGQCWQCDGVPGRLDVMIDLGGWTLLRFVPQDGGRTVWPAVDAGEVGAAWHGLRLALHARQPRAEPAAPDSLRLPG